MKHASFFSGTRIIGSLIGLLAVGLSSTAWAQSGQGEDAVSIRTWFEMFFLSSYTLGLIIIWLLVLLSVLSIGFALTLAVQVRRATFVPDKTRRELEALLSEQRYRAAIEFAEQDRSFLGRVTHAALNEASHGYAAMSRAMEESADTETGRILRPVEYLNVVGNISPMIGLFGTVYGMIVAFQRLVAAGGNPEPAELAGGISTALVTTFWGLVVAIPALAAYALIRNRIDAMTSEALVVAEELIGPFKPTGRGSAASGRSF